MYTLIDSIPCISWTDAHLDGVNCTLDILSTLVEEDNKEEPVIQFDMRGVHMIFTAEQVDLLTRALLKWEDEQDRLHYIM